MSYRDYSKKNKILHETTFLAVLTLNCLSTTLTIELYNSKE